MEKLYDYILNGLRNSGKFYDANQGTFESYLASLKSAVQELRRGYGKSCITVDYTSSATQAAYLIAYFPQYAEMTLEVLRLLSSELKFGQEAKVCFFGAEPCPEVVGFAQFLAEHSSNTSSLSANVYDIASETWKLSREITETYLIPELWKGQLSIKGSPLNFCQKKSFQAIESTLQTCHLFIFQNCLNEIANTPIIQENVNCLLDSAPLESIIIIADLLYYEQNRNIVEEVKKKANERNDFEILQMGELTIKSSLSRKIPPIITTNLLIGNQQNKNAEGKGLIPRSNINFVFLVLHKGEHLIEDIPL